MSTPVQSIFRPVRPRARHKPWRCSATGLVLLSHAHPRTHARGERIDPSTKPAQVLVGADKFRHSFATPALPSHSEVVPRTRPGVCADCHVNSVATQLLLMRFFACNRTTLVILALSSTCMQPHHTRHSCTPIHIASIVCGAPQWVSSSSARTHRLPCAIYLCARVQIHACSHSTHFLWIAATH